MKQWFLDLKLQNQIIFLSLAIFGVTVSLSCYLYILTSSRHMIEKVSHISIQSLVTIGDHIGKEIDNANNLSNIFLSNDTIQRALQKSNHELTYEEIAKVDSFIGGFRNSVPVASSVYIYDNLGAKYYTDRFREKKLKVPVIFEAPWYAEILEKKGGYILRLNAEDAFESKTKSNFVSLIRIINDLETLKPIGTLILNIEENVFRNCYKNVADHSDFDITLVDEEDRFIVPLTRSYDFDFLKLLNAADHKTGYYIEKNRNEDYLISYIQMKNIRWKLFSVIPMKSLIGQIDSGLIGVAAIIIINSMVFAIGLAFITRLATVPLSKLGDAMGKVKHRQFNEVYLKVGNNEIGHLQECYNIMILEIKTLIQEIIKEQNQKREAALNLLQAQFTPHFLYNTIDTVRSMILSDKKVQANLMLKAMGRYYRICLSKGKNRISIEEEINMVKNYLIIKAGCDNKRIIIEYDLDERLNSVMVLKFVLQPVIENAIKHGLSGLERPGVIKIKTRGQDDKAIIEIEDNGAGMKPENLKDIISLTGAACQNSFGLRATIQRLRLYYQTDDVIDIQSEVGEGTKVTIKIPLELPSEGV